MTDFETNPIGTGVRLAKERERANKAGAKLVKAIEALDEAVYLLAPDERDMVRKAGVYRIVTTLAELKGQGDDRLKTHAGAVAQ